MPALPAASPDRGSPPPACHGPVLHDFRMHYSIPLMPQCNCNPRGSGRRSCSFPSPGRQAHSRTWPPGVCGLRSCLRRPECCASQARGTPVPPVTGAPPAAVFLPGTCGHPVSRPYPPPACGKAILCLQSGKGRDLLCPGGCFFHIISGPPGRTGARAAQTPPRTRSGSVQDEAPSSPPGR